MHISSAAIISIVIMCIGGLILPIGAAIWWKVFKKERMTTILLGAATWLVFSQLLEQIPNYFLFVHSNPVSAAIMSNPIVFSLLGAFMAGLFEETGRFVVFNTFLRNRKNRETSISHGIGHGGMEALVILTISGISNLTLAIIINLGLYDTLVLQPAAASGQSMTALMSAPAQLNALTIGTSFTAIAERIFAMVFHVGASIIVFYAVKYKKIWLYPLAILLHTALDIPAALYQYGTIKSILFVEVLIAVFACAVLFVALKALYFKDKDSISVKTTENA
ncbi:MAG: YhfC family intramembrane metalloprotease [Lachnospiraceae bacterium]|nr:YhfC family intramembrane metalloprotease [Lachnospiraceae bacterium]